MKCPKCESHLITDDNSGIHECAKCHHRWLPNLRPADKLAAVLTQEGADKKLSFADGIELAGARGICRSAIIPESAEGAGTWDNILTTRNDYITAAAAVPAGGDAEHVTGGLKTDAERADALDSLATALESDLCTMGDRIQAAGWLQTFAYQLRNPPAPRGGVTEAMVEAGLDAWYGEKGYDVGPDTGWRTHGEQHRKWYRRDMLVAIEAALSVATPPAAQAQDAGPMARHWREAFALWAGNGTAMGEFDRIEQRARALAAKEAK